MQGVPLARRRGQICRMKDPRAALAEAVAFAEANPSPFPSDLKAFLESGHFEPPPWNAVIGPIFPSPTGRPSMDSIHATWTPVPQKNASSAM